MSKSTSQTFTKPSTHNLDYIDPIEGSVSKSASVVALGLCSVLAGLVVKARLSGCTWKLEGYVVKEKGAAGLALAKDTQDGLKGLIEVALEISQLKEYLGRDKSTVIT